MTCNSILKYCDGSWWLLAWRERALGQDKCRSHDLSSKG
jgi:hypothetical protein